MRLTKTLFALLFVILLGTMSCKQSKHDLILGKWAARKIVSKISLTKTPNVKLIPNTKDTFQHLTFTDSNIIIKQRPYYYSHQKYITWQIADSIIRIISSEILGTDTSYLTIMHLDDDSLFLINKEKGSSLSFQRIDNN